MINQANNNMNFKGFALKSNLIKGEGKPNYVAVRGESIHVVDYLEKGSDKLKTKVLDYDKEVEDQLSEIPNFEKGIVMNVINKAQKGANHLFVSVLEAFENSANRIVTTKAQNAKMVEGNKLSPISSKFSSESGKGIKQLLTYVPDNKIKKDIKPHQAKQVFEAHYHKHPQGSKNRERDIMGNTPDGRWKKNYS